MTTHTCDCGVCDWTWRHVPAADHKPKSLRPIHHVSQYRTWPPKEGLKWDLYKTTFTGTEIFEVPHTYAYHHGMFGYMNEKQLAIGGIVWIALGPQGTSCYMPFYAGVSDLPGSFAVGDRWTFDRDSARWAFDYTDFHVQVAYNAAIEDVKTAQEGYEGSVVARIPEIDARALELFRKKPARATEFLTGFCLDNARTVVRAWWDLGDRILVKYNHFGTYDPEKRTTGRIKTANPSCWQKAVKAFDVLLEPEK